MTVESFNNAVGTGSDAARYSARFDAIANRVSEMLSGEGLHLGPDDREALKAIGDVKMAVFTSEPLAESVLDGVKSLPGIRAQIQLRELNQQVADPNSDLQKELRFMSPARRMSLARELESAAKAQEPKTPQRTIQDPDHERTLRWILSLPYNQRISAARSAGIRV